MSDGEFVERLSKVAGAMTPENAQRWVDLLGINPSAMTAEDHRRLGKMVLEGEERRAREAPLVALVAAVPEGLDPVGWRAAVLAVSEMCVRRKGLEPLDDVADVWKDNAITWVLCARFAYGTVPDAGEHLPAARAAARVAVEAYRRALAPASKVQPERRRERGPVVVVDRGDDD